MITEIAVCVAHIGEGGYRLYTDDLFELLNSSIIPSHFNRFARHSL